MGQLDVQNNEGIRIPVRERKDGTFELNTQKLGKINGVIKATKIPDINSEMILSHFKDIWF